MTGTEIGIISVSSAAFLAVLGIVIRMQNSKISEKVSAEFCRERERHIAANLKVAADRLECIESQQSDVLKSLGRIEEAVSWLKQRNGG